MNKKQSQYRIIMFQDKYVNEVVELWNSVCGEQFLYKPFTKESFEGKFLKNPYFDYEGTFICVEGNEVIGFANGIYRKDCLRGENFHMIPGYITMFIVRKDKRKKGMGRSLVNKVEEYLNNQGKNKIRIDFFNPINLEWYIPNTLKYDHPNAPGVDTEGEGYEFLKHIGYKERTVEVSMYRELKDFTINKELKEKYNLLYSKGISIEYYSKLKHLGLQEFFDNLKNEFWRKDINDNLSLEKPFNFLIASDKGKVCGFAGPLEVEFSGRGKFCGIGVDPSYQGKGIGKLLFFKLCESFRSEGAEFMSLFTGENGKARKLYADAGFKVVRKWALFNKEV